LHPAQINIVATSPTSTLCLLNLPNQKTSKKQLKLKLKLKQIFFFHLTFGLADAITLFLFVAYAAAE
jgi:hypothetical protein